MKMARSKGYWQVRCARPLMGLFALAVVCFACRPINVIEPNDIPREEVASAVLRTPSAVLREGYYRDESDFLRIVTVDGERPRTLDNRVVLAPGPHQVQLAIELRRENPDNPVLVDVTRSDTSLSFTAVPDGEYLVDAELRDDGLWIWIVEEFTGEVVAGRHPSGRDNISRLAEDSEQ